MAGDVLTVVLTMPEGQKALDNEALIEWLVRMHIETAGDGISFRVLLNGEVLEITPLSEGGTAQC